MSEPTQRPDEVGDALRQNYAASPDPKFTSELLERLERDIPTPHWWNRHSATWGLAAAALLLIGIGVYWRMTTPKGPELRHEGSVVWIDGKPYVVKGSEMIAKNPATMPSPATSPALAFGLTPKVRSAPATQPTLAIGDTLATSTGQRRRVSLPDGSILYLNQNTSVKLEGDRQVNVTRGEVFVEVSPRQGGAAGEGTFLVKTPSRQVTALGTKFQVKVADMLTGVLVTQGKVKVNDVAQPIAAGQQLDGNTVLSAPRACQALGWTADLMAAAESPLVPASDYAGGALIAVDPNGQEARLSLRKYTVDVYIEDGFARTTIDQTYFNHENWRMEGTFYFPLPADASLSRLAMYVDGRLMEGGMAEREKAREVYEQILYTRRDPALLEWVDGTTFKMRVFPLEGRQEKRLVLSYTQKLDDINAQTAYRFPAGHNLGLVRDWAFHAQIKNALAMSFKSDSHDDMIKSNTVGQDLILDASAKHVKMDQDIVLRLYDPAQANKADSARFASSKQDGSQYLMLRYRPNLPDRPTKQRRDWVFLMETSGNRDPLLARAQVEVIRNMLANAEHDDTFAILTAGTRVNSYLPTPQLATPENIREAIAFLEKTHLIGALDLGNAISEAARYLLTGVGANPVLVHVGSGIPALGERRLDVLAQKIPQGVQYVGVGVGKKWSRAFMKQAAGRTGGCFTQINPDESIAWRSFELMNTLNTPRLMDVKVTDESGKLAFLALDDAVSQGQELCAIARLGENEPMPANVQVSGTVNGQEFKKLISVKDIAQKADYLARTWAKLEIDRLLAENAETNKARVIELSKAMYVMSPFTSLLVLEDEKMYETFHVDRGRKDHWAMYPCPEKIQVVYEPDPRWGGTAPNAPKPEAGKKQPATQVLNTILIRIPPRLITWPIENYRGYYGGNVLTAGQYLSGQYGAYGYLTRGHAIMSATENVWFDGYADYDFTGDRRVRQWAEHNELFESAGLEKKLDRGRKQNFKYTRDGLDSIGGEYWAGLDMAEGRMLSRFTATPTSFVPGSLGALTISGTGSLTKVGAGTLTLTGFNTYTGGSIISGGTLALDAPFNGTLPLLSKISTLNFENDRALHTRSRIAQGYTTYAMMYQRPNFRQDMRVFSDLLQLAPGMNTSYADIQAALEAEAADAGKITAGVIEEDAHKLIDQARSAAWQTITIPAEGREAPTVVTFDGAGRFVCDHTIGDGLRERVVCDGKTLWHLYPDLGVGARRSVSRFHRADLAALVPWLVLPAEDLAFGADLRVVDKRTVAIIPPGADTAKDEDGKPLAYARIHLIFSETGGLVERRIVEMPSGKVLYAQKYAADGTVTLIDGDSKEKKQVALRAQPADAPQLSPDTKDLVVLDLPYRTRDFVMASRNITINEPAKWTEADALAVIASETAQQMSVYDAIARRFFSKDDRRIGFYVLAMAAGNSWDVDQSPVQMGDAKISMNPAKDHPDSVLARYIVEQLAYSRNNSSDPPAIEGKGFIERYSGFRNMMYRWISGRATNNSDTRKAETRKALEFVRSTRDPYYGWAILSMIRNHGVDSDLYQEIADVTREYVDVTPLSYSARYEYATALYQAGKYPQAREAFASLYRDTLAKGAMPLIDSTFRSAFQQDTQAQEQWPTLMREASAKLTADHGRAACVYLAWQCHQSGDPALAEEMLGAALMNVPEKERLAVTLAAVEYTCSTGQYARADGLIQPLLEDKDYGKYPELWRLGSTLAANRGMLARSLTCLEQAIDLEYQNLPTVVNLQAIRSEYGQLLSQYQQLANAIVSLEKDPPKEFVAKVIRNTDRWRSLDSDGTMACNAAARVLQRMGEVELAWEYLTTPLAEKPNESTPWVNIAQQLRQEGEFSLADKAYVTAFEIEPTNAQILWDRASLLQQTQQYAKARDVYQQIADGKWQPRFEWMQRQAKGYVNR